MILGVLANTTTNNCLHYIDAVRSESLSSLWIGNVFKREWIFLNRDWKLEKDENQKQSLITVEKDSVSTNPSLISSGIIFFIKVATRSLNLYIQDSLFFQLFHSEVFQNSNLKQIFRTPIVWDIYDNSWNSLLTWMTTRCCDRWFGQWVRTRVLGFNGWW